MDTISQAVGIRNGSAMMPNNAGDLRTITRLLDRIPLPSGGTAATPGLWLTDRRLLIDQITAAIVVFQTTNRRPVIDGVVDPSGGTLREMNRLAAPGPVAATVTQADSNSQLWVAADPGSMAGTSALRTVDISPTLTRKLVRVDGSNIKWFGVVIPTNASGGVAGGSPHLFFTPSPWQGGYLDPGYDQFNSWQGLWDKYTSLVGSQLVTSGAAQILVIPFYKNSQAGDLGDFLLNWREVIREVVTAAILSTDPLFVRDKFEFGQIFTSSFSNGIVTLQNFETKGAGVANMTQMSFNLDGQASGSQWNPARGQVYKNTASPRGRNPEGTNWYVGGRLENLRRRYPGSNTHNLCPFLLLHGLATFCR